MQNVTSRTETLITQAGRLIGCAALAALTGSAVGQAIAIGTSPVTAIAVGVSVCAAALVAFAVED